MNMTNTLDYNDILEAADYEADSIYTDYSGRFMYGATCFGFVGNQADYTRFIMRLPSQIGFEDAEALVDSLRTDNMALDMIYYFPGWTLTDVPEDTDE